MCDCVCVCHLNVKLVPHNPYCNVKKADINHIDGKSGNHNSNRNKRAGEEEVGER